MNRHYLYFIASLQLLLKTVVSPLPIPRHRKLQYHLFGFPNNNNGHRHHTDMHSLPLERYTKKQNQKLATINEEIHLNQSELKEFDSKLRQAAKQNDGPLSAWGNCHLKMGHIRRNWTFSSCRSAFSCGILTKHLDEKGERACKEKKSFF